jgi:hypothetical protein
MILSPFQSTPGVCSHAIASCFGNLFELAEVLDEVRA